MTTLSNRERWYHSGMSGAPTLSGTAGALIAILDACLVEGFDVKTINSLAVSGGIATATISAGHTYGAGEVIRVAGVTPSSLNGDWRLAEVTGSTAVWSVAGLGIADGSASGTMTAKRAPAGWAKIFSATGKACYQSLDLAGTRLILRVDDTGTTTARVRGYETMSDVDTGSGPFPTDAQVSGGAWVGKADTTSGTRAWAISADARSFAFMKGYHATYPNASDHFLFGDTVGAAVTDPWACLLSAPANEANALVAFPGQGGVYGNQVHTKSSTGSAWMPRSYSGTGNSVTVAARWGAGSATGFTDYPLLSGPDDTVWAEMPEYIEGNTSNGRPRGRFPCVMHAATQLPESTFPTRTLIGLPGNGAAVFRSYGASGATATAYLASLGPWS